ncbi:hypothetical protein GLAREA_04458 [Glarea lozoyensis ATCC 20868]|uniref:Uncharacterized protein n=1 Tax=Glarea lozoyensis (strain ATCC 20868 / MF5171) TaxID=1116229 RepID=S3CMC3_GLAL2|nr:uncharacterized protein GLAREA_04458 [Glarea lozoyensis ATCC 20868]EPE27667.1 hypothetical protein GLAREA_04458 [Glarea lozoyensis ATCC 20868]
MSFAQLSFIPVIVLSHLLPTAKTHGKQQLLQIKVLSEENTILGRLFLPVLSPMREVNDNEAIDESTSSDDENASASSASTSSSASLLEVPSLAANTGSTTKSLDFQNLATELSKLLSSSTKDNKAKKDPPKGLDGKPQVHSNKH